MGFLFAASARSRQPLLTTEACKGNVVESAETTRALAFGKRRPGPSRARAQVAQATGEPQCDAPRRSKAKEAPQR